MCPRLTDHYSLSDHYRLTDHYSLSDYYTQDLSKVAPQRIKRATKVNAKEALLIPVHTTSYKLHKIPRASKKIPRNIKEHLGIP